MTGTLRARGNKPAIPSVPGPSKTSAWSLGVTLDGQTMDSSLAGIRIGYADAPPALRSDLTSIADSNTLINIADTLNFNQGDSTWSASMTATISSVAAAAGHNLYVALFDSSAGVDAPVIAVASMGAVT